MMNNMKTCTKCKIEKELFEFHNCKNGNRVHCKECCQIQNRKYYLRNKEKRIISIRKWQNDNDNKKREYQRKFSKTEKGRIINKKAHAKHQLNPRNKISHAISSRVRKLIKDKNKTHVFDILNYSIKDLLSHLESKFRDGMTWENYGFFWHIDHVKPISLFNFNSKNDPEFKECWALDNLQPLLVHENLSKGNRFIG